jgi:hypothetical protein
MASEISVERQFCFHCSCGATTVSGEKEIACSDCGATLGVRRVRRHRQQRRDSVAYYGSSFPIRRAESQRQQPNSAAAAPISPSWTIPVRRVVKRRQSPTTENVIPRGITSRLRAWLRSTPAYCGDASKIRFAEAPLQHTNIVLNVEAQGVRDIPEETRALPVFNELARVPLRLGVHVRVGPIRPDGKRHPHAGKTGRIRRFIDTYSDPYWLGRPSAMIRTDAAVWPQRFIWVSVECLEALPEIHVE